MKKPGAILLFVLFTCVQLISIVWYYAKPLIHTISEERQKLSSIAGAHGLLQLSFDKAEFSKLQEEENENEIRWNGKLYDIEKIFVVEDKVTVLLRKDEVETNLLHLYTVIGQAFKKANIPRQEATTVLWKWFQTNYIFPAKFSPGKLAGGYSQMKKSFNLLNLPVSPYLPCSLQPPEWLHLV